MPTPHLPADQGLPSCLTQQTSRAGEIRANTTTYSAHLNQPPNRWGAITAIAWLSKAPLYAEVGASSLLRLRQQLAQNDLTDCLTPKLKASGHSGYSQP
jgi:hypothetical protein